MVPSCKVTLKYLVAKSLQKTTTLQETAMGNTTSKSNYTLVISIRDEDWIKIVLQLVKSLTKHHCLIVYHNSRLQ